MTQAELDNLLAGKRVKIHGQSAVRKETTKKRHGRTKTQFQSLAEERYFNLYVRPMELSGKLERWEMHESFVILDGFTYQNHKYQKRVYTPDFMLYFKDGSVWAVEVKGTKIKKLQREYPVKKQLFIQKYCIPNGWIFQEVKAEDLTSK